MQNTTTQAERQPQSKQQRKNRKNRRRWLERLTELWPQAFSLKNPRPLAVGIVDAISTELNATSAGGHGAVRYPLKSYTGNIRYMRALAEGGARYNLNGEPDGDVTPEQQQRAAQALKAMRKNKVMFIDEVTE